MKSFALFALLCLAPLCSAADSLYIVVLQPVKAGAAPFDVTQFGGTLEHRSGLRLAVRVPESAVHAVKGDARVRYVQRVIAGQVERPDRPAPRDRAIVSQAGVATESVGTIVHGPYSYDGTGNIWSIGPTPTPDQRFTYDRIGRLSTAKVYSQAMLHEQSFAYDAPGNLTNVTTGGVSVSLPVQGNTNRLATSAGFTYDATGNMTASPMSTSYSYDQLGMLTSDASAPYTNVYTASDERLAVIKTSANPRWRWTLRDLSNQRVRDFESFGPTGTEYFLWLEDSYHDGSRVIASQRELSEGGWRHFHLDHLGTPRLTTNEDGRQISRHDYLPFGIEVTSLRQERNRGFAREQVSRFTGHERDYLELTNADEHSVYLDYMHARTYNPNWARFLSVDPFMDAKTAVKGPQMWNRYAYVSNNPMRFIDPTGKYQCQASKIECKILRQAIADIKTAAAALPKGSADRARLERASAFFGEQGQKNGVVLRVGTSTEKLAGTVTDGLVTMISVNIDFAAYRLSNGRPAGVYRTEMAGLMAHEAEHGIIQRITGGSRTKADNVASETSAFLSQAAVNAGFQTDSVLGIWTRAGGLNEAKIQEWVEEANRVFCSQPGANCQ